MNIGSVRNPNKSIKMLMRFIVLISVLWSPGLQVVWKIPEKLMKGWAVLDSARTLSRQTRFD
jgi:hypothetical protein